MRLNHCTLIGRLADDPKYDPASGDKSARCSFRIGVNRIKSESTDWIPCVVFGPYADVCAQHLKKGKEVAIEGELRTNSIKNEDGTYNNYWNILCSSVQFGRDSKKNQGAETKSNENIDDVAKRLAAKAKTSSTETKPSSEFATLVAALVKQGVPAKMAAELAREELAKKTSTKTKTTDDPFSAAIPF